MLRKIIHIDMDAFYASVAQRDDPSLRGKPVIVGGDPRSRGVVCAASYEARRFGVRSAMSCAQAYQRCPEAIFVLPDFNRYKEASQGIHQIFNSFTDRVEALSLDEAFLDVSAADSKTSSAAKSATTSATWIAQEIRRQIFNTLRLPASAGVSTCKFIAKIASDANKPNGICVVAPSKIQAFLDPLPVRRIPGIGKRSEEKLLQLGVRHIADLRALSLSDCTLYFAKQGQRYYELARGIDERPVISQRERVSIGAEHTYPRDVQDLAALLDGLEALAQKVAVRLDNAHSRGHSLCLKVKYHDFHSYTHQRHVQYDLCHAADIFSLASQLFHESINDQRAVRLLGLQVGQLDDSGAIQESLSF